MSGGAGATADAAGNRDFPAYAYDESVAVRSSETNAEGAAAASARAVPASSGDGEAGRALPRWRGEDALPGVGHGAMIRWVRGATDDGAVRGARVVEGAGRGPWGNNVRGNADGA